MKNTLKEIIYEPIIGVASILFMLILEFFILPAYLLSKISDLNIYKTIILKGETEERRTFDFPKCLLISVGLWVVLFVILAVLRQPTYD